MPFQSLINLPDGSDVFIDANILVYGLSGQSAQCRQLLERCSREEVTGITPFTILNEATHRFMLAEAHSRGLIRAESARALRENFTCIPGLTAYWRDTQRLLSLNLLLLPLDEAILRAAQSERQQASLLTNDSMIASCMRLYGISTLATNDEDFERVQGIAVYRPDDLA
jgi:predicted nucleic acid-binding protein